MIQREAGAALSPILGQSPPYDTSRAGSVLAQHHTHTHGRLVSLEALSPVPSLADVIAAPRAYVLMPGGQCARSSKCVASRRRVCSCHRDTVRINRQRGFSCLDRAGVVTPQGEVLSYPPFDPQPRSRGMSTFAPGSL